MGQNRRLRIREAARNTRSAGQTVTLLFEAAGSASRATPFSITTANAAPSITVDSTLTIYAVVHYKPLDDIKYDEAGRVIGQKATIQVAFELGPKLVNCIGVKMPDGSVLRKARIELTEGRDAYLLDVEGYVNIAQ